MSKLKIGADNIELKPCPFCGRQATIVMHPGHNWDGKAGKHVNIGANHGAWYVGCSYSFFEGIDVSRPRCEVIPGSWCAHLEDAIREWNGRDNSVEEENKELKTMIQHANNYLSGGGCGGSSVQRAAELWRERNAL